MELVEKGLVYVHRQHGRQPQLIIYETFNVPAMYEMIQAVLSLYASDG